jgi:serine/threonine protein kinase
MDYLFDISIFEEGSVLCDCGGVLSQLHQRLDDYLIMVKSMNLFAYVEDAQLAYSRKRTVSLRNPSIAVRIGVILSPESAGPRELKIAQLFTEGSSLAEILGMSLESFTLIVKAKAVAGVELGLAFVHSFGLIHGRLTVSNILFGADHCIEIAHFGLPGFHSRKGESTPEASLYGEVLAVVSLLLRS